MRMIVICLVLAFVAGCDLFPDGTTPGTTTQPADETPDANPPPDPTQTLDLNGNWRHAAAGTLPETCITVENQRITRIDDGCNGNLLILLAPPDPYVSGAFARLSVNFVDSPDDDIHGGHYHYVLEAQPDGTLRGTGGIRYEPDGPVVTGDVVWERQ